VGNRESVAESDFYTELKKLDVPEGNKNRFFADHVTRVCEAHDLLIVFFFLSLCSTALSFSFLLLFLGRENPT